MLLLDKSRYNKFLKGLNRHELMEQVLVFLNINFLRFLRLFNGLSFVLVRFILLLAISRLIKVDGRGDISSIN